MAEPSSLIFSEKFKLKLLNNSALFGILVRPKVGRENPDKAEIGENECLNIKKDFISEKSAKNIKNNYVLSMLKM